MEERLEFEKTNQYSPSGNQEFLFIDLQRNKTHIVKTDSLGVLKIKLPAGKFAIKEKYKDCTYRSFYSRMKVKNSVDFEEKEDEDCYRDWWKRNLGEIVVINSTDIQQFQFTEINQCFIGNNPCIRYIGPYPP